MGSSKSDVGSTIYPEPIDHFDTLPDSILLLIFNNIADVKSLGRICVVSRRFHSLVPQVDNVVVKVDCVISDDINNNNNNNNNNGSATLKSGHPISSLLRLVFTGLLKPFQSLTQLIYVSTRLCSSASSSYVNDFEQNGCVTHHSPAQVLKHFDELKLLRIELPNAEYGMDDAALLKWKATFGSTLDNCVILGASSMIHPNSSSSSSSSNSSAEDSGNDNGSIPESFYTNGGLKLRVVWTISSLVAASARHYLLQQIIAEHKKLDSLILTDVDGQGVLCMNKEQLEELRVKPLSASSASKRTTVPALNMRLWYSPHLELPDGTVLKGATLVAIRPSDQQPKKDVVGPDANWVGSAFEEPYGTAARMLVKRRTYCLEMNSF